MVCVGLKRLGLDVGTSAMKALFFPFSLLWCAIFCVCVSGRVSLGEDTQRIRVATWNVENLFDTENDPDHTGDDEFTTEGWRRWSEERYQLKTSHLAEVIGEMRPDVLFMQEVENRAVLTNLVRVLGAMPEPYELPYIAHVESPSERGIDVAILSKVPFTKVELHMPVEDMRGILEAHAQLGGVEVVFYACHWKSWLGDMDANKEVRKKEAECVRMLVEKCLEENPESVIFVAGDFNDNCDGESITQGLRAGLERVETGLYHVVGAIPENERGSFYYARRKVWNTFDGIVIPAAMLRGPDREGPEWRLAQEAPAVGVFKNERTMDEDGRPKPFRRVRKKDGTDVYMEGYSDHFPIWADFVRSR